MTRQYKKLTQCLCCNSSNLSLALDLGQQPLANSYLDTDNPILEFSYPLKLLFCVDCSHLQLSCSVNPDLLFKNYLYVSGTTQTLRDYFNEMVITVEKYIKGGKTVLDIACNDGSQLDSFKRAGYKTYGIDPAVNLHELSKKNHFTICEYFTSDTVRLFPVDKFDIILAQNVFAHVSYPKKFAQLAKTLLSENGKFFIQTSQANMVSLGQFDTIYHEHISFFNIRSMVKLLENTGLYLQDVLKPAIHGTSYIFVLSQNEEDNNSKKLIESEILQDSIVIDKFKQNAFESVDILKKSIDQARNNNYPVIGYGAAAKGNTLLNFGRIKLDYIVDDNPLKHGLFTPGQHIPIVSLDYINKKYSRAVSWVPLSWNFFTEIKKKIITSRPDKQDQFIQIKFSGLK